MTDSVDAANFPILPGAIPFLARPDVWSAYRVAHRAWMIAGRDIDAEIRADIYKRNSRIITSVPVVRGEFSYSGPPARIFMPLPRNLLGGDLNCWTHGTHKISLSAQQREACDAFYDALNNVFGSALERLFRLCEIKAIYRFDATAPWNVVDREALAGNEFRIPFAEPYFHPARRWETTGGSINRGGAWCRCNTVKLLDFVGVSLDQAVFAYAEDRDEAAELEVLERIGAPDHVGRLPAGDAGGWYGRAADRWRVLHGRLAGRLLERLGAGELVAIDAGELVAPQFWQGLDSASEPDAWRPGALVRCRLAEDVLDNGKQSRGVPRGRPSMHNHIEARFRSEYPEAGTSERSGKLKTHMARELVAWAHWNPMYDHNGKKIEVPDQKTVAGWIGNNFKKSVK